MEKELVMGEKKESVIAFNIPQKTTFFTDW